VLDGLGAEPREADVGIRAGRIVAVGDLGASAAPLEIDARGLYVCPGFIDLHSHADETCFEHPGVESAVRQGVTTLVVGQDGFSLAPVGTQDRSTFAGYLASFERHPLASNVASLVGQGTIRRKVMGERAGPASAHELAAMRALADEALLAGAFGISSGLEYPPSANAGREELGDLCRSLASLAPVRGLYVTHMRNEDDALLEAIEEAIAIARRGGARLHVSHLKASGRRNWPKLPRALALLEAARDVSATADCYPYEAYSTTLQNLFPASARAGGTATFLAALRDAERARPLRAAAEAKVAMLGSWDAVMLTDLRGTAHRAWDGRRVGEVAASLSPAKAPIDLVIELLLELEGRVGMFGFGMSEDEVARALASDLVCVASDGSALAAEGPLSQRKAHPRAYGTFPRVLRRFVRERSVLAWPQAIRKMTSLPARILGLPDRGTLEVGQAADLVVLDPKVVADRATYDDPHQYPVGIPYVIVNGEPVVDAGKRVNSLPGRVLRRGALSFSGPQGDHTR
jgi:N-acyl-D-amino-acid deacylase